MKIMLNINIRSVLIFDRNLVGGDEVVRSSSFSTCRHDCGRDRRSAVLRDDHHCDVVWWSMWSELGGAAQDVVDVVWWSAELLGTWSTWSRSTWSELGGAAWDVVDVVAVDVVGAQRSCSGHGRISASLKPGTRRFEPGARR